MTHNLHTNLSREDAVKLSSLQKSLMVSHYLYRVEYGCKAGKRISSIFPHHHRYYYASSFPLISKTKKIGDFRN